MSQLIRQQSQLQQKCYKHAQTWSFQNFQTLQLNTLLFTHIRNALSGFLFHCSPRSTFDVLPALPVSQTWPMYKRRNFCGFWAGFCFLFIIYFSKKILWRRTNASHFFVGSWIFASAGMRPKMTTFGHSLLPWSTDTASTNPLFLFFCYHLSPCVFVNAAAASSCRLLICWEL